MASRAISNTQKQNINLITDDGELIRDNLKNPARAGLLAARSWMDGDAAWVDTAVMAKYIAEQSAYEILMTTAHTTKSWRREFIDAYDAEFHRIAEERANGEKQRRENLRTMLVDKFASSPKVLNLDDIAILIKSINNHLPELAASVVYKRDLRIFELCIGDRTVQCSASTQLGSRIRAIMAQILSDAAAS